LIIKQGAAAPGARAAVGIKLRLPGGLSGKSGVAWTVPVLFRKNLTDAANGLIDALDVFHQGEADVSFASVAEAQTW